MNPPPHSTLRRAADRLLVAAFVVAMLAPLAGLLHTAQDAAGLEKRARAPWPGLPASVRDLQRFPARFEKFFNDRFALRDDLIRLHNRLYVSVLKTSPKPAVLLGREDWLFFNSRAVENTDTLADFAGTPLEDRQLRIWTAELERYRTQLAARGILFAVAVAPNKEGLYPERMPSGLRPADGPKAIDQWMAAMRATTKVSVIDLRTALAAAPNRHELYARTDSHWNSAGAAVAHRALMEHLQAAGITGRVANTERSLPKAAIAGGDLAQMLGLPDLLREPALPEVRPLHPQARMTSAADPHTHLRTYLRDDPASPVALILRDSFTEALEPFLAESFRRLDLHWGLGLDETYLDQHKPDVVLLICAERNLRADPTKLRSRAYRMP